MSKLRMVPATEPDLPVILDLIHALAEYEKLAHIVTATQGRPGHQVRCRGPECAALHGLATQAHQPPGPLAERSGGKMDRKLPPGVAGPCNPTPRTAPTTVDRRFRSLLSRGPDSRWPGQGHSEPARRGEQAKFGSEGDFHPTPGRSPSPLRLATSRLTRGSARRTHSGAPVPERVARHRRFCTDSAGRFRTPGRPPRAVLN